MSQRCLSLWRPLLLSAIVGMLCIGSLFFITQSAYAAGHDYYVAVNGSDSNPGTLDQPFQTIQQCANIAIGGDTCNIHEGTYHETVTPKNSGSTNAPITFRSFNHDAVTIDGADPVSGWSHYQGNIYQTTVQSNPALFANQLFLDGTMINEAGWPYSGSDQMHPARSLAEAGSSVPTLYDSHLTQPDNFWVGATVHIWGQANWAEQTGTVTASTAGKLTISGADHGCPYVCLSEGDQYELTGSLNALIAPAQWYYDSAAHTLYLWTPKGDSPASHAVEMKQRNYAFDLTGKAYIHLHGLRLFADTITTDQNSNNNVIDSIFARYLSHFSVVDDPDNSYFGFLNSHTNDTGIILNGTNNTLSHSDIGISAGNGVALRGSGNTVTDNLIHDVDYMSTYAAGISALGDHQSITHNTIYRTGRDGIGAGGSTFTNNQISYNDIFNTDILTRDAGSIYICCGTDSTGSSIDHNYIHDTQVNVFERFDFNQAGVYLDNGTSNMLIHHNVFWNNANDDLFLHTDGSSYSKNNLVYNNTFGGPSTSLDCCVGGTTGNQVINNIFRGGAPSSVPGGGLSNNLAAAVDPRLVNESTQDYHLQAGSPAIDAGKIIPGITDGYAGSAPDIGAYEYGAADWTAGSSLSHIGTLPAPFVDGVSTSAGTIQLQWNAVQGAIGYKVHYGTNSGVYQHTFDAGSAISAALPHLLAGQNYFMAVTAYNAHAESHASTEVNHFSPGGTFHVGQVVYANAYDQRTANTSDQGIAVFAGAAGQADYLEYDHIDFGSGANAFTLDVANDSHFANQPLEIHLDSPTGTLIGTLKAQGTGSDYYLSWRNFTPQRTLITPTSGVHKVFLVSKAAGGTTVGFIHSFTFSSIVTHDAFSQINGLSFDGTNGKEAPSCNGTCLGQLDGGTWVKYDNVNFGDTGAGQLTVDIAVPTSSAGRSIQLHLDSPTGTLIGTLTVQSTGDFYTFAQQSTYISQTKGLHTLYLVVTGAEIGTANINWFTFGPAVPSLDRTGWTATASSSAGDGPPSGALDGDVSTRWGSGAVQTPGQTFQVDMQSPQTFSKILLDANQSPNDYPQGYQVYVSNDGINFGSPIASGVGSSTTVITFPQQVARYIKIVQTGSSGGQWWSIDEFLVYA